MNSNIKKLFSPSSLAIIGASDRKGSVGNELMLRVTEYGYKGIIHPINTSLDTLMGYDVPDSVLDVQEVIDLAIIAVPAAVVAKVLTECGIKKIGAAVIISSGFREIGGDGIRLEQELIDIADKYNIALLGPNCLGVINTNPRVLLDGSFAPLLPEAGTIGFATQSGALASGIINVMPSLGVGLAQMVSLGNQASLKAVDIINYWESEGDVGQILLYLESISDVTAFKEVATRVTKTKPIVAIKSGRSDFGAKAAASHTGALAGSDKAADALLSACGVIREDNLSDMFISAQCFSKCALPKGKRVGIITNAGGVGILATDEIVKRGLSIAALSGKTKQALRDSLPPQASVSNPVDVIASASVAHYERATELVLSDENVDILLCVYLYITGRNDIAIVRDLNAKKKLFKNKTIVAVFMTSEDFRARLSEAGLKAEVPIFAYAEEAVHGLARLVERSEYLREKNEASPAIKADKQTAAKIFADADQNGHPPTTYQALEIFRAYGIKTAKFGLAKNAQEACILAKSIGYPLVIKLDSCKISHKTDVGGVVTNILNEAQLISEVEGLVTRLTKAKLMDGFNGIVVMEQIKASREFVAGVNRDPQYGHLIMFGLGGVYIEALNEVNFRLLPLSKRDAKALLATGKTAKLLGALRGNEAANMEMLEDTLFKLNQLIADFPQIDELDINPIMVNKQGEIFVVDARIS